MGGDSSKFDFSSIKTIEELKCFNCGNCITCPPVTLYPEHGNACGRCQNLSHENPIRNKALEAVLQQCNLPCRYSEKGCSTMVECNEVLKHEENCYYKTFSCGLLPPESCKMEMIKNYEKMTTHFTEKHPELIYKNEFMSISLYKNYHQNIFIDKFCRSFYFHIKYNNQKNKLWCSLIYFEDSEKDHYYAFSLELSFVSNIKNSITFESDNPIWFNITNMENKYCSKAKNSVFIIEKEKMLEIDVQKYFSIYDNSRELKWKVTVEMKKSNL